MRTQTRGNSLSATLFFLQQTAKRERLVESSINNSFASALGNSTRYRRCSGRRGARTHSPGKFRAGIFVGICACILARG